MAPRKALQFLVAAVAGMVLTIGPAAAAQQHIAAQRWFEGAVNGYSVDAPVSVVCSGRIGPGSKGHPSAGQTWQVMPGSVPFTGRAGTQVMATLAEDTSAPVAFSRYGMAQPIPVSLLLPCSGHGSAVFEARPASSGADTWRVRVRFTTAALSMETTSFVRPAAVSGPSVPHIPAYPPSVCSATYDGLVWRGPDGDRYVCKCVKWAADQPCSWVWVNIDATAYIPFLIHSHGDLGEVSQKALFTYQTDGNLVVYDENMHARWSARTQGGGAYTTFQSDGNLVVYNASGHALWASGTCCNSSNYLSVQNDGNVVIYLGWHAIWATGTNH